MSQPVSSMIVSGNTAFLTTEYLGMAICDISNRANPQLLSRAPPYRAYEFLTDAVVSGNYVYAAAWTNGLRVYDVSDPSNPVLLAHPNLTARYLALSGNYLYVAGNSSYPIQIFNVSDPSQPALIGLAGNDAADSSAGHKLAIVGNHLYLGDVFSGFSVFTLSLPSPPPLGIASLTPNTLTLSWPTPNPEFAIQQTAAFSPANWVTLTNIPFTTNSRNQVILPNSSDQMFYRLISQ